MSNGKTKAKVIPPIRIDDVQEWRLEQAAGADRLALATWLRNLGLKRADELGIPSEQPRKVAAK